MRPILFVLPVALSGCFVDYETPHEDRAIRSFNGDSVVIQSKTPTVDAEDIALAQTACPDARYTTTNFIIEGVSEYLFLC